MNAQTITALGHTIVVLVLVILGALTVDDHLIELGLAYGAGAGAQTAAGARGRAAP